MNILAFHTARDASAALLCDGRLTLAVAEEKFDAVKGSGGPPLRAIAWLLDESGLRASDIDVVAHAGRVPSWTHSTRRRDAYEAAECRLFGTAAWRAMAAARRRAELRRGAERVARLHGILADRFGFPESKVVCVEHHTCHASAPLGFHGADGRNWLIFTMDAAGDGLCATVSVAAGDRIERLASTPWEHSLGWMYARTTEFLGFRRGEHAHKLMGLAGYVRPDEFADTYREVFDGVAWLRPDSLEFDSRVPMHLFDRHLRATAVGRRFDHVAAAAQALLESLVVEWVRRAIRSTGISDVMTGGGVFMNVKVNKRLQELPEVGEIRFMPSCGDETNPLGAAYHVARASGERIAAGAGLYLGPGYDDAAVRDFVERHGLRQRFGATPLDDPEARIAELLADHEVVGRFAGRAELGARALGNRSLLAHPGDLRSFFEVNEQIKRRDFWMPFAPALLDDDAERYLEAPTPLVAPYMITAFDTTVAGRDHLRAAVHPGDLTARPQIVTAAANPSFHRLLGEFKRRTGIGGVLNTSLNLHGHPLAATLDQALFTFERSGLRHLALERWLLSKPPAQR